MIWMAPEIFNNEKYTEKAGLKVLLSKYVDVYSFAMILLELNTRKIPFDNVPTWSIPVLVSKGQRPEFLPNTPNDFVKLTKSCWHTK